MKKLTVFYDHHCGLCRSCRRWLKKQHTYFPVDFVAYDSLAARALCPEIGKLDPDREIIAMADNGDIYRGGNAWVMCLYATREHRPLAMKLASPLLLPIAKKVCALVAANRLNISSLLRLKSDREVAAAADALTTDCKGGTCNVNDPY